VPEFFYGTERKREEAPRGFDSNTTMQNQVGQTPNSSKLAEILLQLRAAVPSANSQTMPAAEVGAVALGTEEVRKNTLVAAALPNHTTDFFHLHTTTRTFSPNPLA
jgi:hypothetical protein